AAHWMDFVRWPHRFANFFAALTNLQFSKPRDYLGLSFGGCHIAVSTPVRLCPTGWSIHGANVFRCGLNFAEIQSCEDHIRDSEEEGKRHRDAQQGEHQAP